LAAVFWQALELADWIVGFLFPVQFFVASQRVRLSVLAAPCSRFSPPWFAQFVPIRRPHRKGIALSKLQLTGMAG
jgi:hypothetical protein